MRAREQSLIILAVVLGVCGVSWGQKTASNPNPADGATGVTLPLLQWTKGDTAIFHNVYFGTIPELTAADQVATNQTVAVYFHLAGFEPSTRYYWRVDEVEADRKTVHTGDVWTFITQGVTASKPDPADGATFVSLDPVLTWLPGMNARQHHLYFSDNREAVSQAAASVDKGLLPPATTAFTPGHLKEGMTYYWRVDEIRAGSIVQAGPVWSFTTIGSYPGSYTFQGGIPAQAGAPAGLNQATLVIYVRASDDSTPNLQNLRTSEQTEFTSVTAFFRESSFNQLSFNYTHAPTTGWYQLGKTYDDYMWTQADIDAAPAGSADRQTAETNRNLVQDFRGFFTECLQAAQTGGFNVNNASQVVVVIIGPFHRGTSYGPVTFSLNDNRGNSFQATLPVVVVSTFTGWSRTAHEFGHAFGRFADFYGAANRRPGSWDIMDCTDCGSQTTGWHKNTRAGWFSGSQLKILERPSGINTVDDTTVLAPYEMENAPAGSVQSLRLDVGAGLHLYVENRQKIAGQTGSQSLPANAVIITDADDHADQVNATRAPVLLFGDPVTAGNSFIDQSYGDLRIQVSSTGTPQYLQVRTQWWPDPFFDLRITPWSPPPWDSPDIWIDSPVNGWDTYEYSDASANPTIPGHPVRNGDRPRIGRVNRLYARVFNDGYIPAGNVRVSFYVSDPPGIGDVGNWVLIERATVAQSIAPGGYSTVSIPWTPSASQHTCLIAKIDVQTEERNANNNGAHENVGDFDTTSASPWKPIYSELQVSNPTKVQQKMRLEMNNLPSGWTGWVSERFVPLAPGETKRVQYSVDPGTGGPMGIGSRADINIVGWILDGDREIPLGGVTSAVHLVQKSQVAVTRTDDFVVDVVVTPSVAGLPVALDISEAKGGAYRIANGLTDNQGRVSFRLRELQRNGIIKLDPGTTYVFRVLLYGSSSVEAHTSPDYTITTGSEPPFQPIDDFEGYTDEPGDRIFDAWSDGLANGGSGSVVGNANAPFAEQTIVHYGAQSMPMDYNNATAPYFSETELNFSSAQNWTADGYDTLALYVRGAEGNKAASLYLGIEDTSGKAAMVIHGDSSILTSTQWTQWRIPLSSFTGVNVTRVRKLYIGVGDRKSPAPGGSGRIYIDDIRVTKSY